MDNLKPDTTYSKNHNLPLEQKAQLQEDKKDASPHLLPSQVSHNFKSDTEESTGTYEDYKALKNIE